mgnify:CR=1 FL=1
MLDHDLRAAVAKFLYALGEEPALARATRITACNLARVIDCTAYPSRLKGKKGVCSCGLLYEQFQEHLVGCPVHPAIQAERDMVEQ